MNRMFLLYFLLSSFALLAKDSVLIENLTIILPLLPALNGAN